MTKARKTTLWITALIVVGTVTALLIVLVPRWRNRYPVELVGVVLRQDTDPRKQVPIPNASITASDGNSIATASSDSAGLFKVTLPAAWKRQERLHVGIRHSSYRPLQITADTGGYIYVARLLPLNQQEQGVKRNQAIVEVTNVRVRYTVKSTLRLNTGSAAKAFEAVNTNGIPCGGELPCSPDGKWKASLNSQIFDAGTGNEFNNARLSCIAGPCPFTRVESDDLTKPSQRIRVAVLNWSDTTTFLLEAEVTHLATDIIVRQLYPVIFGPSMNFTLPGTAVGPSILAEMGKSEIVFPLGPALRLSWAVCTVTPAADRSRQYRCQLKPGYEFK
jgi:hypothetical protein